MTTMLSAALLLLSASSEGWCQPSVVTGYVRTDHSAATYDGTPIWTDEPIVAASWNFPLGWYVEIPDVGTFRIADRGGGLGSSGWIDVAVWELSEAFALTRETTVCVYPPDGG